MKRSILLVNVVLLSGLMALVSCNTPSGNLGKKGAGTHEIDGRFEGATISDPYINWETSDSISVFFDYENFYGSVVVKKDETDGRLDRVLLLYEYDGNEKFVYVFSTSALFGPNDWGVNGDDPYDGVLMTINGLVVRFVSGDPVNRLQQEYCFGFSSKGLWLKSHKARYFNITDVDESGSLNIEYVEESDFVNNKVLRYDFVDQERVNLEVDSIEPQLLLINDIHAMEGIRHSVMIR